MSGSVSEASKPPPQPVSAARRSACTNLWASLFVFLAALLRLDDLLGTRDASGEVI